MTGYQADSWLTRRGALVLLALPLAAHGLPWDQDMVDQPAVKPQATLVIEPVGSVPVDGAEQIDKPEQVADLVMARVAAADLANPHQPGLASVEQGKVVYEVHCLTCHGATGKGDGPVGLKFVPAPMDLTNDYVQNMPDGQLYYTITRGSIVMPFYRDAIPPEDRWHLVNYVKHGLVSE